MFRLLCRLSILHETKWQHFNNKHRYYKNLKIIIIIVFQQLVDNNLILQFFIGSSLHMILSSAILYLQIKCIRQFYFLPFPALCKIITLALYYTVYRLV